MGTGVAAGGGVLAFFSEAAGAETGRLGTAAAGVGGGKTAAIEVTVGASNAAWGTGAEPVTGTLPRALRKASAV